MKRHLHSRTLPYPRCGRRNAVVGLSAAVVMTAVWLLAPSAAQAEDLFEVYLLALDSDPEFQAAAAANRAAQEATPLARANLLPDIGITASTFGTEQDIREPAGLTTSGRRNFNASAASLTLTQPLYRKDRWIALDQAKRSVSAADAGFEFSRQSLMLRVAQRYFDVLRAKDNLTFARAEQEAFGQQLEQSQQRFEVGLIAITDVEEAKAGSDLSRARVIQAENALDNAREALREVTGKYLEMLAGLSEDVVLDMPEPNDIEAWTASALEQNLELRTQMFNSQSAMLEIQRSEAGHLPTLDLVGEHSRSKTGSGTLGGSQRTWNSRVGVQLSVPIYSGGSVLSRTRQSRHEYQQSLDELERIRRAVQRQTRNSFLGVASGISRVQALQQAVVSTRSAVEAIEAGFQVGTRTTVDVLNAQRDLFEAQRDYADARYTYVTDILSLKQAAGNLGEDDLRRVNDWLE